MSNQNFKVKQKTLCVNVMSAVLTSIVATDALVLNHQAISIPSTDFVPIVSE